MEQGDSQLQAKTDHRATVGIVGGMGPLATASFYRTLVMSSDARSDQDHLHILIESDPAIPDRTAFLLGHGPDPRPAILRVAQRLEAAGADFLVMPCNTANVFADDIGAGIGVPLVPWISTTVEAVVARQPDCVGILATTGTLVAGGYQKAFAERGVKTVQPSRSAQRVVMDAIYGVGGVKSSGGVEPANRGRLLTVAAALTKAGADVLLLACTELPLAIAADDADWPVPAVDPAKVVARRVLEMAGRLGTAAR